MKRWGVDRMEGLLSLYLGPFSLSWTWGPGGVSCVWGWIFARKPAPEPLLRVVEDDGKRPCSICRGVHGREIVHECE